MAKVKKNEFNPDLILIELRFLMKGFRQEIIINTTATQSMEFVDWINNNPALKSYKRAIKDQFNNKFYIFDDYKKKETISINLQEVRYFKVPFYLDCGEEVDFKYLIMQ